MALKLTPLDVQQQEFAAHSLGGYNKKEVQDFLKLVRESLEEMIQENNGLKEQVRSLSADLESWRGKERMINETLLTAQKLTEEIKINARKEADLIIAQAEFSAERIINNTNTQMVGLMDEIADLKRQKISFYAELKAVVDAHRRWLEEVDLPRDSEGELKMLKKQS